MRVYIRASILISIFLLMVFAESYAQSPEFAQSRFIRSSDSFISDCARGSPNDCIPLEDGIAHMRFANAMIDNKGTPSADDDLFIFTIQIRKTGTALPLSVGNLGADYNEQALGTRVTSPAFWERGVGAVAGGQCTYERGIFDDDSSKRYSLSIGVSDPPLSVNEVTAGIGALEFLTAAVQVTITDEWQDFITFSCQIRFDGDNDGTIEADEGTVDAEVGMGFNNVIWAENQVWIASIRNFNFRNRRLYGLADNDLRGFRLDGKTWVEDYARYDNGAGVRLKFSKGIMTDLQPHHFTFEDGVNPSDVSISNVDHDADSEYANITFNKAVVEGILRHTTATSVVNDIDGDALANGNFMASLHYFADAPRVSSIEDKGFNTATKRSTWEIIFNKAISDFTVDKDNLCITGLDGLCAEAGVATTPHIVSTVLAGGTNTTMTVVVQEGDGKTANKHSIEFRRNAVIGEDWKIVEDYQTELRDAVEMTDTKPPKITVTAEGNAEPNPDAPLSYRMSFIVEADEPVASLNDVNSYQLISLDATNDASPDNVVGTPTIVETVMVKRTQDYSYTLTYTFSGRDAVKLADIAQVQDTYGFTLARKGDSLGDGTNGPVRSDDSTIAAGARISPAGDDNAVALRDATPPRITVTALKGQVQSRNYAYAARPADGNGNQYTVEFKVGVANDKEVQGLDDINSYRLIRIDTNDVPVESTQTHVGDIDADSTHTSATVSYTVTFDNAAVTRGTKGFALGRAEDALLDNYSNEPVDGRMTNRVILAGSGDAINSATVATALRDTTPPSYAITVTSNRVDADGYHVTFGLSFDFGTTGDFLRGGSLGDVSNFVLLRKHGSSYTVIDRDFINSGGIGFLSALGEEDIVLSAADARETEGFTVGLASACAVTDLANNCLVDPASTADPKPAIAADQPVDSRATALAPRTQSGQPLTVVANDIAVPTGDNSNVYTGSFTVDAASGAGFGVPTIATPASYSLLRISTTDTVVTMAGATITSTVVTADREATISFSVDLDSRATVEGTKAFTLARRQDLIDYSSNPPIKSMTNMAAVMLGDRIDPREAAELTIDLEAPVLTVVASEDGAVPDADDGNKYTLEFGISSTKPLATIDDEESYVLLQIPIVGAAIELKKHLINTSATTVSDDGMATTLTYTLTFPTVAETQRTKGFTLARAGASLQDKSFNDPVRSDNSAIAADERIDNRGAAVSERDIEKPLITVSEATAEPDMTNDERYDLSFKVSASEQGVRGFHEADSYDLLQVFEDGTVTTHSAVAQTPVRIGNTTATVTFNNVMPKADTDDSNPTVGFTLARQGDALRDLANNDPVVGANNELGVTDRNNLVLNTKDALAEVDRVVRIRVKVFIEGPLRTNNP